MRTFIQTTGTAPLPMPMPRTRMPRTGIEKKPIVPDPVMKFPPRGSTGPVPIGTLLEPLQQLFNHPDRNRLLAELFKNI